MQKMNYREDQLDFAISQATKGDKVAAKRLYEEFIAHALMDERSPPRPQLVKYIANKLHELEDNGFKDARNIFGFQDRQELSRTKSFLDKLQLVFDVNYCIENGFSEGAEGATKKLVGSDFYEDKYKNENSMQAAYRKAVKQLEAQFFRGLNDYDSEIQSSNCEASEKGKVMSTFAPLLGLHQSSPFDLREEIDFSSIEISWDAPNN